MAVDNSHLNLLSEDNDFLARFEEAMLELGDKYYALLEEVDNATKAPQLMKDALAKIEEGRKALDVVFNLEVKAARERAHEAGLR